ncbi:hypothetical protein [Flavobacterium sp. N1994]|uniref:hypothetical protein n=1 Tax=Flavobacterium sp. N1994 TaxID=2986827 RepID=UPI0022236B46|nr:hypothetical protein [Flavobacterium sp. N1994]
MKSLHLYLLVFFLYFVNVMSGQNGYTLKFESAFFMSSENPTLYTGSTAEVVKTFTVPANCVLEINSGCVESSQGSPFPITRLKIGDEYLTKLDTSKNWQPILVKEGTVVSLIMKPVVNRQCLCGYVAGTLYRKVPN